MLKPIKDVLHTLHLRLEELACPYLEDNSEQWLAELMLHPSEARLRLITWLLCTFDMTFEEFLNTPIVANRVESKHEKLLIALNIICACSDTDFDLVRGTANHKKQIQFWDHFVNVVYTSQFGHPFAVKTDTNNESFFLKPAVQPSLSDRFDKCCQFVDILVRENRMSDLFSPEIGLFPSHVVGELEKDASLTVPNLDVLIETAEKLNKDISRKSDELEKLLNNVDNYEPLCESAIDSYCRKFDLSLKTLLQMIDLFLHNHESHFESWCKQKTRQSPLSAIGPTIKVVADLGESQSNLYDGIEVLKSTYDYFSFDVEEERRWYEENLMKPSEINEIREITSVLKGALNRTAA